MLRRQNRKIASLTRFVRFLSGNLTNDLGQTFTYDATGQQAMASYGGYWLQQSYDGDGLRVKKIENGTTTYYLRSSVLGGQVVAELNSSGVLGREYVYLGGQLLALRAPDNGVLHTYWVHEDPITKSKRVTDKMGAVVSTIELDPWGAEVTDFSNNTAFQPRKFTSYERDGNGSDEAMFRRYNRWHSRFDQPDPSDGSYDSTNPQSFNRYAYVQGDPVNFVDPSGLMAGLVCLVDGVPSSNCSAAFGLVSSGAGVIYGGTGWYGDGEIFVIDHLYYNDRQLNTWQTIYFLNPGGSTLQDPVRGGPTIAEAQRRKEKETQQMNQWRAKKLKDCLEDASRTYHKEDDRLKSEAAESIYGLRASAGSTITGLIARSAISALGGFAVNWALSAAYYVPQQIANKNAYQRARANCHSLYDQR